MEAQQFDAVKAWQTIKAHLDMIPVSTMCSLLHLDTKWTSGHLSPAVCPRKECRCPRVYANTDGWACPQCVAGGRSAAMLAASVAGWLFPDGDDEEQVRADYASLIREALFLGAINIDVPGISECVSGVPGFDDWHPGQRGIYTEGDREKRLREFAKVMLRTNAPALSVLRATWAMNCTYAHPPLTGGEVARIINQAAQEVMR